MTNATIRTRPPRRRRAAWAAVAGTLLVMACGGDPAAPVPPDPPPPDLAPSTDESESPAPVTVAPPPQPESPLPQPPPPTAEPEEPAEPPGEPAEPPGEPAEPPGEPPEFVVDDATVWQDVFELISAPERSCIRSALGDDLLDDVLERPLGAEADTPEWEVSIFDCLAPDTARSLFLAVIVEGLREEMGVGEVDGEEMSCLRDLVGDLDVAALVAASHAGNEDLGLAQVTAVLVGCLPDVFLAEILVDLGVDMADLGPEELSCLRGWLSAVDWAEPAAAGDDTAAFESLENMIFDLLACIPEAFGSPGPDDHGDFAEEATAVTVGEPAHGVMGHFNDADFFTFEALEGESYRLEVTLESLEDSVMVLYDAGGRELASNDDRDEESLGSLISWVAPESGSYYVEVASFDPFVTGSYTLSVTSG